MTIRVAEVSAGLTGALLVMPSAIGYGLIILAALGPGAAPAGILLLLVTVIVGGAVCGLCCGTPGLAAGGSSAISLLLATLVANTLGGLTGPAATSHALAVIMAASVLCSALVAAMAMLRFGAVVPLIPYPVLAGIVNGTAVLMLLGMARHAIGLSSGDVDTDWRPGSLLVAASVLGLMLLPWPRPAWLRRVPLVVLAILASTGMHYLLRACFGPGFVGPVLGGLPPVGEWAGDVVAAAGMLPRLGARELALHVVPVAFTMALLAVLETLSAASALQDATRQPGEARRDLLAMAGAGLMSGLAGGIMTSGSIGSSIGMMRAGARSWQALVVRSLTLLACCVLLGRLVGLLPFATLAGVVIASAWGLVDLAGLKPLRQALRPGARHRAQGIGNALVILVVAGVAVEWSLLVAVLVGLVLALLLFALAMARNVVRRSYANPGALSRVYRPGRETDLLLAQGARITVIELEGAIFFGSADQVTRRVAGAVAAGADQVILDMRRVSQIDYSGARRLLRECSRFWQQGLSLSWAWVRPGLPVWDYLDELRMLDDLPPRRVFASLDMAVEAAEAALLQRDQALPPAALTALEALAGLGIPAAAAVDLLGYLRELVFPAGRMVVRAGDPADDAWLVLAGILDVTLPQGPAGDRPAAPRTRLTTLTPGVLAGELALISNQPRSADVMARTEVRCLLIGADAMAKVRQERPDLAYLMLNAVAMQVQQKLRLASTTIASLEA